MNASLANIIHRRAMLVARAAAQREEIDRAAQPWRAPLAFADRGIALFHALRQHPLAAALAAVTLAQLVFRKRHRWMRTILAAWQVYRGLRTGTESPRHSRSEATDNGSATNR